ncbi:unnamed protein product [Sphagnum troendelagicum]|uniref:Alpha N-terminal protein methyltransferase 1 n=1 Tax=Sphagnum troendelagicum TaxID=128251 RepID=A0ABP0T8Z1_9BRYO
MTVLFSQTSIIKTHLCPNLCSGALQSFETQQEEGAARASYPGNWSSTRGGLCCSTLKLVVGGVVVKYSSSSVDMEEEGGLDSDGRTYSSRKEMWEAEAGEDPNGSDAKSIAKKLEWYHKGVSYWESVEASVDGVLGGYGSVNARDVADSNAFILEMFNECPPGAGDLVALDCGAGVGRVTKNFLLHHFHEVDLVEPVHHFLDKAQADLGSNGTARGSANSNNPKTHRAVNFYCTPLQDFSPEAGRYDVIWVQWCIGHLTDHDFIAFFKRAQAGLKPGGFFVLKENIAKNGFVVDKSDSSVTRSDAYFRDLFKQTGLHLQKTKLQKGFPKDLFAVRMYALTSEPRIMSAPPSQPTRASRRRNQPRKIH